MKPQIVSFFLFGLILMSANARAISDEARLAYEQGDYLTAKILLTPAANSNDSTAQYFLGYMAYMGFAQKQDKRLAATWFKRAAKSNHADAIFALGVLARDEPSAGIDQGKATQYFSQAAKLGHAAAKQILNKE